MLSRSDAVRNMDWCKSCRAGTGNLAWPEIGGVALAAWLTDIWSDRTTLTIWFHPRYSSLFFSNGIACKDFFGFSLRFYRRKLVSCTAPSPTNGRSGQSEWWSSGWEETLWNRFHHGVLHQCCQCTMISTASFLWRILDTHDIGSFLIMISETHHLHFMQFQKFPQ